MAIVMELAAASLAGALSHLGYFIRGEHHLEAPKLVRLYFVFLVVVSFLQIKFSKHSLEDAFFGVLSTATAYAFGLFGSIVIYRLYFHRLRRFPGPPLAKVTKFYHMWNVSDCKQYSFLEKLHQQYGDFVRTGPNEITIFTPEGIPKVLGPDAPCTKSPYWDMMWPEVSLLTTRSKENHDSRRRVWDRGFSVSALRAQEPRISQFIDQFEKLLAEYEGKPINVTEKFGYYVFDVMGSVNFGFEFNMLSTGKQDPAVEVFKKGMFWMGPFTPVPWLFHIAKSIPGSQKDWFRFRQWGDNLLRSRIKTKTTEPDMISWAINHAEQHGGAENRRDWLLSDVLGLISAGSEPVLCTMVFAFYHLASDPSQTDKLRQELASVDDLSNHRVLQNLPHLNGVINESLRLHPSLPSSGLRETPPEGITVAGTYIPGKTTVLIPQYSLGRREDCYEDAQSFVPERWYSKSEMVKDKGAFIPFNTGNYNCLGQNVARMELRMAIARIVSRFDFRFAPGETGEALEGELLDLLVSEPGPLKMVFTKRDAA